MHGAELKANSFNRQVELLRARLGPARFAALEHSLSAPTRALIAHPPLPMSWMPVEHAMELLEAALEVSFEGRTEELFALGREQFIGDMSTLYRAFMRLSSPHALAERAGSLFTTYQRGGAEMKCVAKTPHSVDFAVGPVPLASPAFWAYLRGTIHAVIELSGVRLPHVVLQSGGERDANAVFHVRWQ